MYVHYSNEANGLSRMILEIESDYWVVAVFCCILLSISFIYPNLLLKLNEEIISYRRLHGRTNTSIITFLGAISECC
ncbi:putative arabinosyltransferase [Dirofilaria immitis]